VFHRLYKHIEQQIEKIYFESKLNELFKVLPATHEKIILALVQQSIKYDLLSYGGLRQPIKFFTKRHGLSPLVFILNLVVFMATILKYCLVPLLYRLIVKKYSPHVIGKNDLKLVFSNTAGSSDRLASIIRKNIHKNQYLMLYLFTSFPRKVFERLKKIQASICLHTIDKQLYVILMQEAAVIINIILNIILIKMGLGINGVAAATAFTYFFYCLMVRLTTRACISKQQNSIQTSE
jgi:hypothetical protein